jgi:hypothetical protein
MSTLVPTDRSTRQSLDGSEIVGRFEGTGHAVVTGGPGDPVTGRPSATAGAARYS